MKKYIDAELQIVRVSSNDIIATSGVTTHNGMGNQQQLAPARRSIWD